VRNELKIKRTQEHISTVKEEVDCLSVEKQKLQEGDEKLLEKKARELGMSKPGETIIRITDEEINQKKE
jgi:cell division protein FtsB